MGISATLFQHIITRFSMETHLKNVLNISQGFPPSILPPNFFFITTWHSCPTLLRSNLPTAPSEDLLLSEVTPQ